MGIRTITQHKTRVPALSFSHAPANVANTVSGDNPTVKTEIMRRLAAANPAGQIRSHRVSPSENEDDGLCKDGSRRVSLAGRNGQADAGR